MGFSLVLISPKALAQSMQNDRYVVEENEIDIQPNFHPTPTQKPIPEEDKPLFSGDNFTVTTNSASGFEFSASNDNLNFGELSATNPVIRSLNLSLISRFGYQIFIGQNQPLTKDKILIPDTTCDSGTCTEITSSLWKSALAYGFGYHKQGMAENEYMQFPDVSKNEPFEPIFTGTNNLKKEILYKVNISGTQALGAYLNIVTYLSVPSF